MIYIYILFALRPESSSLPFLLYSRRKTLYYAEDNIVSGPLYHKASVSRGQHRVRQLSRTVSEAAISISYTCIVWLQKKVFRSTERCLLKLYIKRMFVKLPDGFGNFSDTTVGRVVSMSHVGDIVNAGIPLCLGLLDLTAHVQNFV
jgi:hypothetical protein